MGVYGSRRSRGSSGWMAQPKVFPPGTRCSLDQNEAMDTLISVLYGLVFLLLANFGKLSTFYQEGILEIFFHTIVQNLILSILTLSFFLHSEQ